MVNFESDPWPRTLRSSLPMNVAEYHSGSGLTASAGDELSLVRGIAFHRLGCFVDEASVMQRWISKSYLIRTMLQVMSRANEI